MVNVVGLDSKCEDAGSNLGGAKVMGIDGICKYLSLYKFYPMLKYACICCVRFVLINLRHCGKPRR